MRLDRERGINFRQAKGVEMQCPMVGFIETTVDLIGKTAETLSGPENDREYFCHAKITNPIYSGGIPQILTHAVIVPEIACVTTFKELLKQIEIARRLRPEREDKEGEKILKRWSDVISQNNHIDTYDFGQLDTDSPKKEKEIIKKVDSYIKKFWIPSGSCQQAPQNSVLNDPLEAF